MALSKKSKRYRGWIAACLIVGVALAAILITRGAPDASRAPSYTTETAETGTLSVTVDGTGNLAVRDEVDVYPSVNGTVSKVLVAVGDDVDEGDALYRLDADSITREVASAKVARQQASTSVTKAKLELYRAEKSLARLEKQAAEPTSTVSSSDITIAEKEVTIAQKGVTSAGLSYDSAAEQYDDALDALDDLEVVAPCDGIVWNVTVEVGDSVTASGGESSGSNSESTAGGTTTTSSSAGSGAPATIARDGQMGVELSINEIDVTTLAEGQDAEIEFDAVADLKMTGTVDEVATAGTIESGVVSYRVWLTLDGTDERLKTGMSAAATIVTAVERGVLLVPNSAVKTASDGTSYVQVLETSAAPPEDVTVTTGISNATQTVIVSGISEGASVITKTTTADSSSGSGSSSDEDDGGAGGLMMMGGGATGGPPAGGPGGP